MPAKKSACLFIYYALCSVALLAAGGYGVLQARANSVYLARPDAFGGGDTRQHLAPFVARQHPEAFTDRLLVDYSDQYLPGGYRWIMQALTAGRDPLQVSKYLGFALLLSTYGMALLLGWHLGGPLGGSFALALTIRSVIIDSNVTEGLFRSFGYPLAFLHLWALSARRDGITALGLVLQALLYPPLFLLMAPVSVLIVLARRLQARAWPWRTWIIPAAGLAFALIIVLVYGAKSDAYGAPIRFEEARYHIEWRAGGRLAELPFPDAGAAIRASFFSGFDAISSGSEQLGSLLENPVWRARVLPAGLLVLAVGMLLMRRQAAWLLACTAAASVALYVAARATAFTLGFPSRYLDFGLPLVAMLLIPAAWGAAAGQARLPTWLRGVALATACVALFSVHWKVVDPAAKFGAVGQQQRLLDAVASLPPDALVSGWPLDILDNIPIFTQRETLCNLENAHPIYMSYYSKVRRRILDTIYLTYATNVTEAIELRDRHGITHLAVHRKLYDPTCNAPVVFQPFTAISILSRGRCPPADMIFAAPPADWVTFEDDRYRLLDLRRIGAAASTAPMRVDDAPLALPTALVTFHDGIILREAVVPEAAPKPGDEFAMTYAWSCLPTINPRDWIIRVHFVHPDKYQFAGDHRLANYIDPTELAHQPHPKIYRYTKVARVPADAPAGSYDVHVGLVFQPTGKPIRPASQPDMPHETVPVPVTLRVMVD